MKKTMLWSVLVLLCVAGCLEIEVDESAGRIAISGGDVNVSGVILQLVADRGWKQERAGSHTSSTSSVRTGVRVSTQDGVTLPGKSHAESSQSYIHAKTASEEIVRFDVDKATGRPTVVRIGVDDGAAVSVEEVTADLARRLQQRARREPIRGPLAIHIDLPADESIGLTRFEGEWTARGDWTYPSSHAQFEIREGKGRRRNHSIYVEGSAPWKARGRSEEEGPVSFRLDRSAGSMLFEGQRWSGGGSGTVTFEPNEAYIAELSELVGARPDVGEVLTLFFRDLDLDYARQIKQVLADELTLADLLTLSNYHVPADYITGIRKAGYGFSVEQIVQLRNYHVPLETLKGFKQAGYDFSADQLIRIRNYHVGVEDFTGFRSAGYDFSIDEMIKVRNYHIPVEFARTLHEAGFRYDLDKLIKLRNYHVPPEYIIAFQRGGYDLSVDEIIKARNYHVSADDAIRLKETGYHFSLDDLISLRNYHVPMDFIIQVHDPRYENFTARELIDFRQRHITAEQINRIRASKQTTQP